MSTTAKLSSAQQQLWTLMKQINNCWYKGDVSALKNFFHNDIVFNSPDFKHQIVGRDNCIQSYVDFLNTSEITLYNESNPAVSLVGNTGVVTYDFEMKYEQNNKTYHETGTDIMVFNYDGENWHAVWRCVTNLKHV